jgi:hypothetical protein
MFWGGSYADAMATRQRNVGLDDPNASQPGILFLPPCHAVQLVSGNNSRTRR